MKLAAGVLALTLMSASATAADLTLDRVYAAPDLSGPRARGLALSPDGTLVTYLRARADNPRVTDLWAADVAGGAPRRLIDAAALIPAGRDLSEAEKSRRERQGVQTSGVVAYDWDDEGRFILAPVEGDLWLWTRADGSLRRLTETPEDEIDARVSPKGGFVSFVRADNLWIAPAGGGEARAVTRDGTELKSWATPEFIAQE
ncbi:MAG: DPP IV N-terminal domain-containing protein, partial [Phenylobacterium sp.]